MVFGEFITVMDVMLISLGVTCRWQTSVKWLIVTWLLEPKLSKKIRLPIQTRACLVITSFKHFSLHCCLLANISVCSGNTQRKIHNHMKMMEIRRRNMKQNSDFNKI